MPAKAPPKKSPSVKKRARQDEKHRLYNKPIRSKLKTLAKGISAAVQAGGKEAVESSLKEAVKAITKAASKGVIHKNTASRKVSKLSRLANKALKAAEA